MKLAAYKQVLQSHVIYANRKVHSAYVTGKFEVQNPANAEKFSFLAPLMHTYTYIFYNTLHYNIKHIITFIY